MPSILSRSRLLKLDNNQDAQGRRVYSVSSGGVDSYNHMFFGLKDGDKAYANTRCVRNWRTLMVVSAKRSANCKDNDYYVLDKTTGEVFSYLYQDNPKGTRLAYLEEDLKRCLQS
jgi:hypothetical protein